MSDQPARLPAFDCIVGYHMNPLTCGVAKFNAILGERLGVPVIHLFDPALAAARAGSGHGRAGHGVTGAGAAVDQLIYFFI